MKINLATSLGALALFVIAYQMGKAKAAATAGTTGPGQPGNAIASQAEWWTFAGQWA